VVIGTRIGPYRLVEEVGAGSMGVVYRARDERLQRDVAIKLLPPSSLHGEAARRLFQREARALSQLNHPGIATIHDFRSEDGVDFLVMEYVAGESLDQRLGHGPLPEAETIALGVQLADGLAAAHRQGVIHRDMKPGNLRMTSDGRLKILDFGLARWAAAETDSASSVAVTAAGALVGTPAYIAPELLQGAVASAQSDLYAAGVVLYECATGGRPFPGLPTGALLEAIQHQTPPAPRSRARVSPALDAVIMRCLERDPTHRYASADALAAALREAGAGRVPPPARRARAIAIAAVCVAVAAGLTAVWWWSDQLRPATAAGMRSLAVLPLGNPSNDPEQEYLADGMTEELITQLSHIRALRVISLTSVMRYKHSRRSMPEIARELNVDGVIDGSLLNSHGRLRTTVHLIAARRDEHLWSGEYTGDTTDAFALQSRVASAIAHEIQVRLSPAERTRLQAPRPIDPLAYEFYLRGRYQWNRRTGAGLRLSVDYFERAIRRDSLFALAHAGLADAWAEIGLYGLTTPRDARARAMREAALAVALAPELPEAHTSLAHVLHNFDWDWDGADREYARAIALNPGNAVAHHWRAHLLAQRGRFGAARTEIRRALRLDPLSVTITLASGSIEYFARRYPAALEGVERATELDSTSALLHRLRAGVLDRMGRESEAVAELGRSFALQGHPEIEAALGAAYATGGMRAALQLLVTGLVRKRASGAYEPAEHIAEMYVRMGDTAKALDWLEVAFREHDTELNRLRVDPLFDPLRSDPRFANLLHRVRLDT